MAQLPGHPLVLTIDGPGILDWDGVVDGVCQALNTRGRATGRLDLRSWFLPWPEIVRATSTPALADDPDFERLASGELRQLFGELPATHAPPPACFSPTVRVPRCSTATACGTSTCRSGMRKQRLPLGAAATWGSEAVTALRWRSGCSTSTGRCSTVTVTGSRRTSTDGSTCRTPSARRRSTGPHCERRCAGWPPSLSAPGRRSTPRPGVGGGGNGDLASTPRPSIPPWAMS